MGKLCRLNPNCVHGERPFSDIASGGLGSPSPSLEPGVVSVASRLIPSPALTQGQ